MGTTFRFTHSTTLVRVVTVSLLFCVPGCAQPTRSVPDAAASRSAVELTNSPQVKVNPAVPLDEGSDGAASPPGELLTVEEPDGQAVVQLSSGLPVEIDVVERGGGSVYPALGPLGTPALLFPAPSLTDDPPRAVVRIVPQDDSGDDVLAPGSSDFTFGADFAVHPDPAGTPPSNGNNLMQRGLASDTVQFKIEVDNQRPGCTVKGPDGRAEIRAKARVEPHRWYRVRCSRTGDSLQLRLWTLNGGVPSVLEQLTRPAQTGDLRWTRAVPLSIGGKLAANGAMIRSETDQFNGLVSMPVLQIDP